MVGHYVRYVIRNMENKLEQPNYKEIARQSRSKCLKLVWKAQTSHSGSLLSCADIMAVLFEKIDLDRDKFILSAGWKACMLYYHLWRKGKITEGELNSYCMPGSKFIGLAEPMKKIVKCNCNAKKRIQVEKGTKT